MKIDRIDVRIITRRYDRVLGMHHQRWTEKHAVIVLVHAGGQCGLGEAWCDAGDPQLVANYVQTDLAPLAIGMDPHRPEAIWQRLMQSRVMGQRGGALYAAAGAIDCAIWDVSARLLGLPLRVLLGGAGDSIPVYASGGFYGDGYTPDDLARDMHVGIELGCAGVKVKAGMQSPRIEAARLHAVRQAIGPDAWLMADFLFAPTVPHAIACAKAIAPSDIRFLEAPTAYENFPGWRHVGDATGLPLAGPEMVAGLHMYRDAILTAGVHFLQFDLALCGGITEARRIAGLAAAFGLPISMHCSGSAVSLAANAQFGAAYPATDSIEYHLLHQTLFDRLWANGYAITDGKLTLPETPGLGFALLPDDPDFAKEANA